MSERSTIERWIDEGTAARYSLKDWKHFCDKASLNHVMDYAAPAFLSRYRPDMREYIIVAIARRLVTK